MADEQPQDVTSAAEELVDEPQAAAAEAGAQAAGDVGGAVDATDTARVAELERQVAELRQQIERERDQATDYMRRWHTAQADFANYKRRAQQDQEQREKLLAAQTLAPVLHAIDSLERAFLALPATLRTYSWIEGIALVELQLRRALELQGIRAVEAQPGQVFDPNRHEAIGEVESEEYPEGVIVVVAQHGYEAQGLLIRPALVQVARAPKPPSTEPSAEPSAEPGQADVTSDASDTSESSAANATEAAPSS